MKVSKLSKLVKACGSAIIVNDARAGEITRQFVCVGGAVYPLDGFPQLDKESLLIMLDIPADKKNEYQVAERPLDGLWVDITQDTSCTDAHAWLASVTITAPMEKVIPVYTKRGMLFLSAEQRAVIADATDAEWYVRSLEKGEMLVAKRGFQLIAAFSPSNMWISKTAAEDLENASRAVQQLIETAQAGEYEQLQL